MHTSNHNKTNEIKTNELLRLDFNENSLGMSDSAKEAILNALDGAARYPDKPRAQLLSKVAEINGVPEKQVLLGNGSIESIRAVVQMLYDKALKTDKRFQLIIPDPTFGCAELYAHSLGVPVVKVPLTRDNYDLDFDNLQKAAAEFDGMSLFYLCNPNNPTAIITATDTLKAWIKNAPKNHYFLLDEAYFGYVTDPSFESGVEWIKQGLSDNLIVVRTFSKLFGLAGLRVGYAIGHPQIIAEIGSLMSTDNINVSGAVAAIATLEDEAFLAHSLQTTNQARQMMETALDELGLRYLPSQTNFMFYEVKGDVQTYIDRMKEHGIAVGREFPSIPGFNRITLGTPEEMTVVIDTLQLFRKQGWV